MVRLVYAQVYPYALLSELPSLNAAHEARTSAEDAEAHARILRVAGHAILEDLHATVQQPTGAVAAGRGVARATPEAEAKPHPAEEGGCFLEVGGCSPGPRAPNIVHGHAGGGQGGQGRGRER